MKVMNSGKTALVAWMIAASALIGCQKSNNNGGDVAVVPPMVGAFGNCANCPGSPGVIAQVPARYPGLDLNLRLIGDANGIAQAQVTGQNPQTRYYGILAIDGTMNVSQDFIVGNCWLRAGQYALSTVQAGQMQGRFLQVPQIQAVGPGGSFLMALINAGTSDVDVNGMVDSVNGQLMIMQGTGVYGNYSYTTTYPYQTGYPYGTSGVISCNDPAGGFFLQ